MQPGAEMWELDSSGQEKLIAVLEVVDVDAAGQPELRWQKVVE